MHVLLAVDHPEIARLLTLLLESRGYRVTLPEGERDAVARLAQERYHAVVLDVFLPWRDGLAAVRAARFSPLNAATRLIGLTTSLGQQERAERAGLDALLELPFACEELLAELAACVAA